MSSASEAQLRTSADATETQMRLDAASLDRDRMRRAQAGDRQALSQLVTAWQDRIFSTMRKMACDEQEAMDLTQEAFARAISRLASFRGDSAPFTWMYRIAVNVALSNLRQKKRRKTTAAGVGDGQDAGPGILDGSADPAPGPADQSLGHERAVQVREALARLEPEQRALLVMCDVDGMDYQRIAAVLEAPLGTVKSRIFRARLALRNELKDYVRQT